MEDQQGTIVVEREELMQPPKKSGGFPIMRKAHFLKPISNPLNQPSLPKHPSTYHPLNPNKQLLTKNVTLSGMLRPLESWKSWVDELEQTHHQLWKKVGIFDAIKASTYHIIRDNKLIMGLAEKWCCETNTFVFSWGESTITLEDVMVLGGFSVLGNSVRSQYRSTEGGDVKNMLVESLRIIRKSKVNSNQVTQNVWLNYFKGRGGELEHVGLIVLWLSRYVFTSNSHTSISPNVFSIAVSLTRGVRIAFAPAILAVIYRDFRLLKEKIVHCTNEGHDNGSKLVLWAPFQLLQVWAWERFPKLGPKPVSLASVGPRMGRWHETKRPKRGDVRLGIDSVGDGFVWRPYVIHMKNWELHKFYCDQEMWVLLNSEVDDQFLSFAKCLRTCELVGIDCVEQYLPHRVAMQFALDQDIPYSVTRSSATSDVAWNSYDKPLDGLEFYLPPRLYEGAVTWRYSDWWRKPFFHLDSCQRRRRSMRKRRKFSNVSDTCQETNAAYILSSSSHRHVGSDFFGCRSKNGDEIPSSSKANEHDEDLEINLQVQSEVKKNQCEDIVMEEKEQGMINLSIRNMGEGSKTLEGSQSVGSVSDMHVDNPLSSKGTPSHSYEYAANDIVNDDLTNSMEGLWEGIEILVGDGVGEDKDNEFNESYMNMNEENRVQDEGYGQISGPEEQMITLSCALVRDEQGEEREDAEARSKKSSLNDFSMQGLWEGREILVGDGVGKDKDNEFNESYMNTNEENRVQDEGYGLISGPEQQMNTLSCALVRDEQGEERKDAEARSKKSSLDDMLIISDDENNGDCEVFEAQIFEFEARINRLEDMASTLIANMLKSKAA